MLVIIKFNTAGSDYKHSGSAEEIDTGDTSPEFKEILVKFELFNHH